MKKRDYAGWIVLSEQDPAPANPQIFETRREAFNWLLAEVYPGRHIGAGHRGQFIYNLTQLGYNIVKTYSKPEQLVPSD